MRNKHNKILLISILLVSILLFGVYNILYLPHKINIKNCTENNFYAVRHYLLSLKEKTETIEITIKNNDLEKIYMMQENALKGDKNFEYVPCKIFYNSKFINAKIRLKGDRAIHFDNKEKLSFRIKLNSDKSSILGSSEFSIHDPKAKNYVYEWIFHQALKREGLIALDYRFIKIKLNGDLLGVYAFEEHFGNNFCENKKIENSPIIRLDEDFGDSFYMNPPIKSYNHKKWERENPEKLNSAINLLENFRSGKTSIESTFDIEKLAKYFALCDVLSAGHASVTKSVKFYYNSQSKKLEPIGIDGHIGASTYKYIIPEFGVTTYSGYYYHDFRGWYQLLFSNPKTFSEEFFSLYVKNLVKMSSKEYLDILFKDLNPELDHYNNLMYYNFPPLEDQLFSYGPNFYLFNKYLFYNKRNIINFKLFPNKQLLSIISSSNKSTRYTLKIKNEILLPIKILGVKTNFDNEYIKPIMNPFLFPISPNSEFEFNISKPKKEELYLFYKIVGTNTIYKTSLNFDSKK